jgi:tRNA uridine 5-carboxymethylaminomethyl modification enzyme
MFTSRAEFRLHLRIDNADQRLTPHGRRIGLINDEAWADFLAKQARQQRLKQLLEKTRLTSTMLESILQKASLVLGRSSLVNEREGHDFSRTENVKTHDLASGSEDTPIDFSSALGQPLAQLLKRPEITIEILVPILRELAPEFFTHDARPFVACTKKVGAEGTDDRVLPSAARNELKSVETEIKYEGYLLQQQRAIDRLKKSEQRNIPEWFDYKSVSGLSREMQETLIKIRPRTLGHASRIPGVTPAAVSLVNVYIEIQGRRREQIAAI